jgi:hypothetical protein
MPKIDFKSIGREIRNVQKKVKSARSRSAASSKERLGELVDALERLHGQTVEYCPKGMSGEVIALKAPARKAARPKRRTR